MIDDEGFAVEWMNRAPDAVSVVRSVEAERRLAAGVGSNTDHPLPDLADLAAVRRWRSEQHEAWGEDRAQGEAEHQRVEYGGVRCLRAGPERDDLVVVYAHGGGFCLGSPGTALPITARLARHHEVVSVDYRLAPEHPAPVAIDDVAAVAATVMASGRPVVLVGDSAGGFLALVAAQRWLHHLEPPERASSHGLLRGIVGLSPVVEIPAAPEPLLAAFAAEGPWSAIDCPDPGGATSGPPWPPVLFQSTDAEAIHSSVRKAAARLAARGGCVRHQVWTGLWHAWHYHRELPEARQALDEVSAWIDDRRSVG